MKAVSCVSGVVLTLPTSVPLSEPSFTLSSDDCIESIEFGYVETVHWIMNLFKVSSGRTNKALVKELSRLFKTYDESSTLESIAIEGCLSAPSFGPTETS